MIDYIGEGRPERMTQKVNSELRKDCTMRHENGNCMPAGGFCTANNDCICKALHNAYADGYADGYAAGYAAGQRDRWISMEDAHPVENGWYLVYAPSYCGGSSSGKESAGNVMFSKWSGKNWSIEVGYHKRPGCVTHWMAIPKPPEVKQ